MFTLDALRALYSTKKNISRIENRCLQCVESILVNLPQFAKFGLKKSKQVLLVFFFTSFWIFWSGIKPFCFCECLFHCSTPPSKRTVGRPHQPGSPKYIRLRGSVFLISGEMGKKLLAANTTESVSAEFLLHRMLCSIVNKGPVEIS